MATPEETRERIKEMRERIFERSTEVPAKNDSQLTHQKSDPNKNKTKILQSNQVEPFSSLEDVPTEIIQQKSNKASSLGSEIRNISLDEKNKDSISEIELKNKFEKKPQTNSMHTVIRRENNLNYLHSYFLLVFSQNYALYLLEIYFSRLIIF